MVDLVELVFREFLKISPSLMAKYTATADQILYLILIPHLILFIFLWYFSFWVIGEGHPKLKRLFTITVYIYLLWSGWYGSIIVPVVNAYFIILLIGGFVFFMFTRAIKPLSLGGYLSLAHSLGERLSKTRRLEERLEAINSILRNSFGIDVRGTEPKPLTDIDERIMKKIKENEEIAKEVTRLLTEREEIIYKLKKRGR